MNPVVCKQCGEKVADNFIGPELGRKESRLLLAHLRVECPFIKRLLDADMRPFPMTNTLPSGRFFRRVLAISGIPYEGEPRAEREVVGLLHEAQRQVWVPLWVDLVTTCWSVWIHEETGPSTDSAAARTIERNEAIEFIAQKPNLALAVVTCWRAEGLDAVLSLLRGHSVRGVPPILCKPKIF